MKILAIVGVIVILGGGAWLFSDKSPKADSDALETGVESSAKIEESESVASETKVTGSIEELAAKGGKYKCTFDMSDPNTESSGTVYVEGEKFRGDFKSTVKAMGQTVESHSMSDGKFSYSWSSASPMGFKAPVISGGAGMGAGMTGSMNFKGQGASTSWECVASRFDNDIFEVPAGIQFMESPAVLQ